VEAPPRAALMWSRRARSASAGWSVEGVRGRRRRRGRVAGISFAPSSAWPRRVLGAFWGMVGFGQSGCTDRRCSRACSISGTSDQRADIVRMPAIWEFTRAEETIGAMRARAVM
jgi:hypothetical protein